ncbi:hypothetical protein SCUP234_12652 [Seiridium cupressi]
MMFKALGFEDHEVYSPDEVTIQMDVDTCLEVKIGSKTECANSDLAFEPMDMDQRDNICASRMEPEIDGRSGPTSRLFYQEETTVLNTEQQLIHYAESQLDTTAMNKRKLSRIMSLSSRLIGYDPIEVFAENCEQTFPDWITLLRDTTLPNGITSQDPRIIAAFKAVDSVIGGQGTHLLQRLANVQLVRLFSLLKEIIESDADGGRIVRKPYYGNAKIAMDIYLGAQETQLKIREFRKKLKEGRKRFSKRWNDLARPSPLFVLVYSDAAERIMYVAVACPVPHRLTIPSKDFRKVDNRTLNMVVASVLRTCPRQLTITCAYLTRAAESAVTSSDSIDMIPFTAAQIRQGLTRSASSEANVA